MSELLRAFERFESSQKNPPDDGEDEFTAFLRQLDSEGKLRTFSEEEWYTLGNAHDLDDEEISEMIEQAAGWLGKEKGILESEPADWPEEDPAPVARNPSRGARTGGVLPGDIVGEEDGSNPEEDLCCSCDCLDDCDCEECPEHKSCVCCCGCDD